MPDGYYLDTCRPNAMKCYIMSTQKSICIMSNQKNYINCIIICIIISSTTIWRTYYSVFKDGTSLLIGSGNRTLSQHADVGLFNAMIISIGLNEVYKKLYVGEGKTGYIQQVFIHACRRLGKSPAASLTVPGEREREREHRTETRKRTEL